MKAQAFRHGDICFVVIDHLPKELKESKTSVILETGSGGHPHSFKGGKLYLKQDGDFVIGYLKAKDTKLYHVEHSPKGGDLPNGIYEIRRQIEKTHEGMRQVQD